jgi:hypothetical protein
VAKGISDEVNFKRSEKYYVAPDQKVATIRLSKDHPIHPKKGRPGLSHSIFDEKPR